MEVKISDCFIKLLFCLLLISAPCVHCQTVSSDNDDRPRAVKKEKKGNEMEYPLFNGVFASVDLAGVGSNLFGGDFLSSELRIDMDLKHKFFPTIELGYGSTDTWNDDGIHYKSGAPYFRIGADYNVLYKKQHGQMMLVGLRYGLSSFKYDIESLEIEDPIYGGTSWNPNLIDDVWEESVLYSHPGMKGNMHWIELCMTLRAHIWKRLYMGWGLRFRFKISNSTDTYGDPWYVPGFGKYASNTLGVTYTITYKLPFL